MPETLIRMIEERFPEEDYAISDEGPKGQLLVREVPEEQRLLIHIHRIGFYDGMISNNSSRISFPDSGNVISLISKGRERSVTLNIDLRTPLSKDKRQEYIDLLEAYFQSPN